MVLEAAIRVARETPDPHQERVRVAVKHLTDGVLDAEQVAQAVIRSIIADSDR